MWRAKKISETLFILLLASCGVKGVEDATDHKSDSLANDTTAKQHSDYLSKVDSAKLSVNFDTVFNFGNRKSVDSITLKSGVKLVFKERGSGSAITKYEVAAINYRGMLTNGKVIESNEILKKTVPYVVGVGMTFEAFDEVMLKCKYGDKIKFTIPSEKAYGKKGRGSLIPPNSDLVYEMDIVQPIKGIKTKSGVECFPLIENANGKKPGQGEKVAITYMGWVEKTGKMFDASAATGKFYEFELGTGKAITAWHEAIGEMHKGEKYLIRAPAAACYGSRGVPELVPPNSNLVYLVELKEVGVW